MASTSRILLIDDDAEHRHDLSTILRFLGEDLISTDSASWWDACAGTGLEPAHIGLALIGHCQHLPLEDLLASIHAWDAGVPFVLVGPHAVSDDLDSRLLTRITAVLPGRLSYQPLLDSLHKARLFHEHYNRLRDVGGIRDYNMFHSLVGRSPAIEKIRHMMGQVAAKEVSVLITGESGTGKEVVARNLHLNSARAEQPFVPINCGAIPRELLESELFGHVKGAFTGAISDRTGRFELANGGTLFLDEIGDMPLSMQVKLLRVLQERSFEPVGGAKTIQTDVRILAATHKDLETMIEVGQFRQDLYYRLNVFPMEMPPLRERCEDVPLLLNELITVMERDKRGSVRFNSAAIDCLCRYQWPGNVRELANLVERMAILYPHGIVGMNDLPEKFRVGAETAAAAETPAPSESVPGEIRKDTNPISPVAEPNQAGDSETASLLPLNGIDLKEYLTNLERDLIEQALDDSEGVVARAADRLHIRRTTLVEKMRKYSLSKQQFDERESVAGEREGEREVDRDDAGSLDGGLDDSGKAASA